MCGVDICPVHTRTDKIDPVQANVPARAITYHGDYAVCTLDNPEFDNPLVALKTMLTGGEPPNMFMHMVVKVGPTGALGDVLDAGQLDSATVFKETFLATGDARLDEFRNESPFVVDTGDFNVRLTEIMHESHELIVASVKEGIIS